MSTQTPKDKYIPEPIVDDEVLGVEVGFDDLGIEDLMQEITTGIGHAAVAEEVELDEDSFEDSDEESRGEEE